ncbi:hypothetical protein [Agromyces ramosus]|uniref:hypothetical protein n=1 Tax=Agromyces ramosus TaxID=33879 RepID=UPI0013EE9B0A|nr:hypothetical protein [Agromyces ramosus]
MSPGVVAASARRVAVRGRGIRPRVAPAVRGDVTRTVLRRAANDDSRHFVSPTNPMVEDVGRAA